MDCERSGRDCGDWSRGGAASGRCRGPYSGAPEWFPRWAGRTVVIVASGPSAGEEDLAAVRASLAAAGRRQPVWVTINASYRLAPWADLLYAADGLFWTRDEGARAFPGLKVTQHVGDAARFGLHCVKLNPKRRTMAFERFGEIGSGGNSGFQAVNLAAQAGASRIVLVGFDYSLARGVHWHGPHPPGMNNPSARNCERWRGDLDAAAPLLSGLGIEVLNASAYSTLTAFEKRPLRECLS
jgi:hypothetical protein